MRIAGVMDYLYRRNRLWVGIYLLIVFVMVLGTAITMMYLTKTASVEFADGVVTIVESNEGMALYDDPNAFANESTFWLAILIVAITATGRERRALVSMSVTRYECLLGTFAFLCVLSLGLTLAGGLILPLLCRVALYLAGFHVRGGWSAMAILTGNEPALLSNLFTGFANNVALSGGVTLTAYLFRRWWKPILIAMAAGAVLMIIVLTQLNVSNYVQKIAQSAIQFLTYFMDTWYPALVRYFTQQNAFVRALSQLVYGAALTALSYPIMRRIKVV